MSWRYRYILLGLVAMVGAWFLLSRSGNRDFVNFPPTARGPWVAFGDSLTEGYGATPGNDYPTRLGKRLGVSIMNLGHRGDTTADGLRRLDEVRRLQPRVVLLCFGGNDSLQHIPVSQMIANLALMIDQFHQQGAFVVLIGVRSATLRDQNEKPFRRLAREKRVFYIPNMLKGILARPIYMSDALHPNDVGYGLIAERFEEELRPLLPSLSRNDSVKNAGNRVPAR